MKVYSLLRSNSNVRCELQCNDSHWYSKSGALSERMTLASFRILKGHRIFLSFLKQFEFRNTISRCSPAASCAAFLGCPGAGRRRRRRRRCSPRRGGAAAARRRRGTPPSRATTPPPATSWPRATCRMTTTGFERKSPMAFHVKMLVRTDEVTLHPGDHGQNLK